MGFSGCSLGIPTATLLRCGLEQGAPYKGSGVSSPADRLCQRCSSSMLSATDHQEAIGAGAYGVQAALAGETGKMISFKRIDGDTYKMEYATEDVNQICNQEKTVPLDWITNNGSDIGQAFIDYALPLVQGSVEVPEENGLPKFAYRK